MAERSGRIWGKAGYALFGVALLAFGIVVTVGYFPDRVALVFDTVTVEGTVIESPTRRNCGESACFYAEVQYTTESGAAYTRSMQVGRDARPGDSVDVRYPSGDPRASTTDSTLKAFWYLAFTFAIGPVMLMSVLGTALKKGWQWLRAMGEEADV